MEFGIFLGLLGLILSLLSIYITWYLSKKYYKKQTYKKLYIESTASSHNIFIRPEIENDIELFYKGRQIIQIYNFEFEIKNIGNLVINNIHQPLIFHIPSGLELLVDSLKASSPLNKHIKTTYNKDDNTISIEFKFLNENESFKLKFMCCIPIIQHTTTENIDKFIFSLEAEGLEPIYEVENHPDYDFIIKPYLNQYKNIFRYAPTILGALLKMFQIIGYSISIILLALLCIIGNEIPKYNVLNFALYYENLNIWSIIIIIGWMFTILVFLMTFSTIFLNLFKGKNKTLK